MLKSPPDPVLKRILIEAYYKFAKSKDGSKGTDKTLSKKKSIPDFVKKQWEEICCGFLYSG